MTDPRNSPRQALILLRIIWAGMMLGLIAFMFIALLAGREDAQLQPMLDYVPLAAFAGVFPVAFFARSQLYKAGWEGNAVRPQSYVTGNVIFLAMFEGVAFLSLAITMMQGKVGLAFAPAVVAMAMIVINFPHGRPMCPP